MAISIRDENFAVLFQSDFSYMFRIGRKNGDTYRKGGKQDREENRLKIYILKKKGGNSNPAFVVAYAGHQLVLNSCISDLPAKFHQLRKDTVVFNAFDVSIFREGFPRNFCVSFKDSKDGEMTARNFVDVYNFLHQLKVLAKTKKITEKVDEKENAEENLEEELKEETEEESEEETDVVEYDVDSDGPNSQSWPTHDFL